MSKSIRVIALALMSATVLSASAQAGGFSRGTADTDILFEDGNFNMRAGVTVIVPNRKYIKNEVDALEGTSPYATYSYPSLAVKLSVGDVSCAGTMTQTYGGLSKFASPTASGKMAEELSVNELGATCGYKVDMSKGFLTLIGGVLVNQITYGLTNYIPAGTIPDGTGGTLPIETLAKTKLSDERFGYRIGLAYSIPEIAMRAQIMYHSGTSIAPNGATNVYSYANPGVLVAPNVPASATGNMPQSLEAKVQTGVAPGWLVFGSVKWTDWSVLDELKLSLLGRSTQNKYYYRDGWTISAGVGHKFNDIVSGVAAVQWDRGVGTGWDGASDTWTVGSGVKVKAGERSELSFTGSYTYITSAVETQYVGDENASYASGNAFGLSASFKASF